MIRYILCRRGVARDGKGKGKPPRYLTVSASIDRMVRAELRLRMGWRYEQLLRRVGIFYSMRYTVDRSFPARQFEFGWP